MFKTLITTSLLVAGTVTTAYAGGQYTCQSRNVPAPVIVDVAWARMARFQQRYTDFYSRCGSMIGQLNYAQSQARRFLRTGSIGQAANVLINTLIDSAKTLPPEDADVAYPLTIESIRQGAQVAKSLVNATQTDRNMTARMAAQVKYNVVVKIYNAITKAYTELDVPYYEEVNDRCYGNCVGIGLAEDFNNYFNGVADLAKEFLNIQSDSAAAQGTDKVELGMTAAAAKAAKKIVMNSVFRRDFSCAILELHSIQVEAESFLCQGNPGYNQYSFVEELRQRLNNVNFPARGCGHGRGGYRGGHGGIVHGGYNQTEVNVNVNVEVED
jgi:hypothetical protein